MNMRICTLLLSLLVAASPGVGGSFQVTNAQESASSSETSDSNKVVLEALSRLKGVDLESNPTLKAAVLKTVGSTRGSPTFVELVKDFNLTGQEDGLMELIRKHPSHNASVEAARMLLAEPDQRSLRKGLEGNEAREVIQALTNTGDRAAISLLKPIIHQEKIELNSRKLVVRALAGTQEGSSWLLDQAKAGTFPDSLRFAASTELNQSRWPEVKSKAIELFPPLVNAARKPLPPLGELITRTGEVQRGLALFKRDNVGCAKCHQVLGEGTDFGPALSEIGTKLGKDALYEAILDPSSGISFGYEAWQIETKSGDEAYGLITSETEDAITLKTQNGVSTVFQKKELKSREKSKLSIMPTGLHESLTVEELVDLVEYLASLKKK